MGLYSKLWANCSMCIFTPPNSGRTSGLLLKNSTIKLRVYQLSQLSHPRVVKHRRYITNNQTTVCALKPCLSKYMTIQVTFDISHVPQIHSITS